MQIVIEKKDNIITKRDFITPDIARLEDGNDDRALNTSIKNMVEHFYDINDGNQNMIEDFMKIIKKLSTTNDLINFSQYFIDYFEKCLNHKIIVSIYEDTPKRLELVKENFETNKEIVIDKIISFVIIKYYDSLLSKMNYDKIIDLLLSNDINYIFKSLNQNDLINFKSDNSVKNGIYNKIKNSVLYNIEQIYDKKFKHLCFSCANAYANKCIKIADLYDKDLCRYNFVTDGYQIVDNSVNRTFVSDDMEESFSPKNKKLIITKCNNFIRDKKRNTKKEKDL